MLRLIRVPRRLPIPGQQLGERDAAAVALLVPLRAIWLRGLHCATSADWGVSWLNEPYWDRFFAFLAAWERRPV